MGAGNQEVLNKILIFYLQRRFTHSTATLCLVIAQGLCLGIPRVGNRHDTILFRDQVLNG